MSNIKPNGSLRGAISSSATLGGRLSVPQGSLVEHEEYTGEYEVVSKVDNAQVLNTAKKLLRKNITIDPIPYRETSNTADGITVYIGG